MQPVYVLGVQHELEVIITIGVGLGVVAVALMEIQASRTSARTLPDGTPIPLFEQNGARC